ncbi:family 78 glycoside hydrolase catalytic domain [Agreia sp.]|uniref:family 78 glycoside hydrolase catalytic domain n=1 Tax=Agreia sp. TaxID=1872416 RepID=UPI0035BBE7AD
MTPPESRIFTRETVRARLRQAATSAAAPLRIRRTGGSIVAAVLSLGLILTGAALPAAAIPTAGDAHGATALAAGGISVGTLEVENRSEPLGIDVPAPRFSWITSSAARDVTQTSYRIRVSASAATDTGTMWDSGVVVSNASSAIEYGGKPLDPATQYFWQVDVVTSAGSSTAISTFGTGLFDDDDWAGSAWIGNPRPSSENKLDFSDASWIWTPEAGAPYAPAEPRAFRKTLENAAGKTARSAEIVITADDSYTLWVNGTLLGQTAGAENEWQGAKSFTASLQGSGNVIAVRTTNGPNSPAGLLVKARITYTDGSTSLITSDATWKAVKTIPAGFEARAFDDSAWPGAAVQAVYGTGPWGSGVRPPTGTVAAAPLLRTEFSVDGAKTVASAKIYVAAGGYANVSLNGSPINDEILSPGFTDYDDHAQYTVTDLTTQVKSGDNALGLELGRGFYGMTNPNVWNWQSPPFHDEPVARALLRIQYTDGTSKDVVTSNDWSIHDGPTVLDDLYGGETYDAAKTQPGFDTVGFDAGDWGSASEAAGPKGKLINQQQQPIRVTEELPATEVTKVADGVWRVMFSRVIAGTVKFTAQGSAGTTIRAQYGEKLTADGRVNFSNNGGFANGFQTDRFILAGTGSPETWGGKFSYKGFQYIEVTGWPGSDAPPLTAFTAEVLHTDAPETGSFESSNRIMNETHRAVVDTLLNNIHSIPTDTPMFEKNGWTGDAAVGAEMFLMNLDTQNLFEKWIGDINDSRDANGAPLVIAPSSGQWGQWGPAQPWHSAFVLIPWWLYQYGGDEQVLAKYYDSMASYVDLEFSRSPGGVVAENRLGDWVSPEASPAGGNAPEDSRVSGTAYLYTMLTSMSKTATLLGKPGDAAKFDANAAVVKEGFNRAFLDSASGYYRGSGDAGYRQTHNALALAFGLAPDDAMAQRIADSLAADVVAKGNKLNTGSLGSKYLLPMLTKYGHADLAYAVAVGTEYPSWGYMIENGATTMWEHWSLDARSRGHYFLGTVDDWFYHDVAGIKSSETTGYRNITIDPAVTDQLEWAKGTTQTPFGPVSTDWRRSGSQLTLATHVPVGSSAVVHLPTASRWAATEGGLALDEVEGVHSVAVANGEVLVTVGSGDYSFVVDDEAEAVGAILDRVDELASAVDAAHTAGDLTDEQHTAGSSAIAALRAKVVSALGTVQSGDATAGAKAVAAALADLGTVDTWIASLSAGDTQTALAASAAAVRASIDSTVSALLGVSATATGVRPAFKPGEVGAIAATVTNAGSADLGAVTASLGGLDAAWATASSPTTVAGALPAEATASGELAFTVPLEQVPGSVPATVQLSYAFDGATIGLLVDTKIVVDSPVQFSSATVDPTTVAPGETATVVAVVHNSGGQAAVGHLQVGVPAGWTAPLDTADTIVPAGGDVTLRVPVSVPFGLPQASTSVALDVSFVDAGTAFASASVPLTVALAPLPDAAGQLDHIDLGNTADEQAHRLTASSSSGANTEAGVTRRYAGHLTDFSYFEFDLKVTKGQPFVLRSIETYDRPQTKKYKIYVDGTEVTTRLFSHTGGLGTETYEILVDASFAAGDTVRVKFENLNDHTFYDPSIADVWSLPVAADTTAPVVVGHTTPSTPNRATGWFTTAPVTVSLQAQDDRSPATDVEISYGVDGDELAPYSAEVSIDDEGSHTVSFQARDVAGNVSDEQSLPVKIDTVAPTTTAKLGDTFEDAPAGSQGGPVSTGPGTVSFAATDKTSGVASTEFRVNGGAWASGASVVLSTAGTSTVEYRSTDVAGNVEKSTSLTVTIEVADVTAPTVAATISNAGLNGWNLEGAALSLAAEDDQDGKVLVEYRLGDDAWSTYTSPVELPEGVNVVQFRATDVSGNVSATQSVTAQVDATAPDVWGWLTKTGRVAVVGSDPAGSAAVTASGIARVQYSLDGTTWVDGLHALVATEPLPTSLSLRAVDVAGNVGSVVKLTRAAAPSALTVEPGSRLLIEASGFRAGQSVRIELHSAVAVLGTVAADELGVIAALATVPADFAAGEHELVLVADEATGGPGGSGSGGSGTGGSGSAGSGTSGSNSLTLPTNVLATTGFPAWGGLLAGGVLAALGAALLVLRSRRRAH